MAIYTQEEMSNSQKEFCGLSFDERSHLGTQCHEKPFVNHFRMEVGKMRGGQSLS